MTVETAASRQALRVAGLFAARGESQTVLLAAEAGSLRVQACGDEAGEAESRLPAAVEGELQAVALSARLLGEIVAAVDGPQVALAWAAANTPVVVRDPARTAAADLAVVMPLHDPALARREAQAA